MGFHRAASLRRPFASFSFNHAAMPNGYYAFIDLAVPLFFQPLDFCYF
jgi:hypothetical protein